MQTALRRLSLAGMIWGLSACSGCGAATSTAEHRHVPAESANVGEASECRSPGRQVVDLPPVVDVELGFAHACARAEDGRVWCWGLNRDGELGDGTRADRLRPVRVRELPPSVGVALGVGHSCSVSREGEVHCWGADHAEQLGDGPHSWDDPDRVPASSVPVRVAIASVQAIASSAAALHTCALHRDGGVSCWGSAGRGQVGPVEGRSLATPVPVAVPPMRDVVVGQSHTCALARDGGAYCWGAARSLRPEEGVNARLAPELVALERAPEQIVAGPSGACAVFTDRSESCWGAPLGWLPGRLAEGCEGLVLAGEAACARCDDRVECQGIDAYGVVAGGLELESTAGCLNTGPTVDLACGAYSCCVVTTEGAVHCWGDNRGGQLGLGYASPDVYDEAGDPVR
ncbi:MAG: hypothetical protein EVA89_00475 [Sandaracinaceae bacterium]|nr:MAG: hypothetical protein EVA89_00475 [Sandaracinaceae bacterium]